MPDDVRTSPVLDLTRALIARRSLTPDDAGCCQLIADRLAALGFGIEWINAEGITNLWATYGSGGPLLVLAGHTDVVPPGPSSAWASDPFVPEIRDGVLYGRGAADMKSGLAAMVCAVERLLAQRRPGGGIAFLITSDEEGVALHGTRHVVEVLKARGIKPDYAIVGEATGDQRFGDRITIGRRGSLGCNLKISG
ncbi:MAG: succinyl-diaminopimelate desuccinylase, partial [Xanthomonadaceae bacterium]|nr:succinyl-diaminopimelate desuccinylase [Xanthomonadaceae bacterium]